jgi:hypothetical protein
MTSAICTLFEGHYHIGAAALINSLHRGGFRGRIFCGLRGSLPPWAEPSRETSPGIRVRDFGDGCEIWFMSLDTPVHFTNYKPVFMRLLLDGPAAGVDQLFYLDPDIVVKCPWEVIQRWGTGGLALCEDVNNYLPPGHPLRTGWKQWLATQNIPVESPSRDRYYSGGFLGVTPNDAAFLDLWADIIARIGQTTGSLTVLKQGGATSLFHSTDQDGLNIALMCSAAVVNATGPEGMDFAVGGHLLSHAIGSRKPWRGGFIRHALCGYPPSTAAKSFLAYADQPIPALTPGEIKRLGFCLSAAALIGRFYRRT